MQIDILLRIAGVGLLVAVINLILTKAGREDIAVLATVAGIVIVLLTVLTLMGQLLREMQAVFQFT